MKKSVWLSAACLALLGAPAYASDYSSGTEITDCHAADMPKSVYDACISRSRSEDSAGARQVEDQGQGSNSGEREAGLAGSANDDADGNNGAPHEDEYGDGADSDHGADQDGRDYGADAGDNDQDSRDRATGNWNGESDTEDQSESQGAPDDRNDAAPGVPGQNGEGDDDDDDDGDWGDDGSNA